MSKIKDWIYAFRLRTLFLAVAGVILGSGMAIQNGKFSIITFSLALLLAVSIQILSNLANDLGDFLKGTDTTGKRSGPKRAVQSGKISPNQMRSGVAAMALFTALIGIILVFQSAGTSGKAAIPILLGIGAVSILSALFYTIGRYAYGYVGWGDFFAFFFFGPVAVVGTYFLHTGSMDWQSLLPAMGLGFISTMTLNINNMRDIENDTNSGKITVASKLGLSKAKKYHAALTFGVFAFFLLYSILHAELQWYNLLYTVVFIFQMKIWMGIRSKSDRALDPYLKLTSISGFLIALSFAICINL